MALASSVSLYYSIVQRAARHYLEDYCHTGKRNNYLIIYVYNYAINTIINYTPDLHNSEVLI